MSMQLKSPRSPDGQNRNAVRLAQPQIKIEPLVLLTTRAEAMTPMMTDRTYLPQAMQAVGIWGKRHER